MECRPAGCLPSHERGTRHCLRVRRRGDAMTPMMAAPCDANALPTRKMACRQIAGSRITPRPRPDFYPAGLELGL